VLSREWRRSQRTATPVSLLLIDADSFKAYNDARTHDAMGVVGCEAHLFSHQAGRLDQYQF
jgi:PleD family two-component response regulator